MLCFQGIIQIRFETGLENILGLASNHTFTMAETTAYFEAYRHVLEGLQELKDALPMARYLVECNPTIKPPQYLLSARGTGQMDLSSLLREDSRWDASAVTIINQQRWPPREETTLNESQVGLIREETTLNESQVGLIREETTLNDSQLGLIREETTLNDSTVGLIREETTLNDSQVGLIREETTLNESQVGLIREETTLNESQVGLIREETTLNDSQVGLIREETTLNESQVGLIRDGVVGNCLCYNLMSTRAIKSVLTIHITSMHYDRAHPSSVHVASRHECPHALKNAHIC